MAPDGYTSLSAHGSHLTPVRMQPAKPSANRNRAASVSSFRNTSTSPGSMSGAQIIHRRVKLNGPVYGSQRTRQLRPSRKWSMDAISPARGACTITSSRSAYEAWLLDHIQTTLQQFRVPRTNDQTGTQAGGDRPANAIGIGERSVQPLSPLPARSRISNGFPSAAFKPPLAYRVSAAARRAVESGCCRQ